MRKIIILGIVLIITGSILRGQAMIDNGRDLQEVNGFFDNFLHVWLVEQNIDKAIEFFDNRKLENGIRELFSPTDPSFDIRIWLQKVLTMWLSNNHGWVEACGHSDPNEPGYASMPLDPTGLKGRVSWQSVTEALGQPIIPLTKIDDLDSDSPSDGYLIMFMLNNAPRDGLMFLVEKVNNEWKITGHMWLAG